MIAEVAIGKKTKFKKSNSQKTAVGTWSKLRGKLELQGNTLNG
jgi:hypothetical protein